MRLKNKFPYVIEDVEPEQNKKLLKYFKSEFDGFVRVGPKGYFFPQKYRQEAARIYNMPIRPSDVFVTSFPRSGTTWTQELVWMVVNDLDYEKSHAVPLTERYRFLEFSVLFHPHNKEKLIQENSHSKENLQLLEFLCEQGTDQLAEMSSPRFIKTHIPFSLLPPTLLDTAKVVYVARDPRDVAVSFYHLQRLSRAYGYNGDFKTSWTLFLQNLRHWTPYFEHLKEAWDKRDHPNMLFLFYEELSKDLETAIYRVIKFFSKEFSVEQVKRLCEHLQFDNFKNNDSVNNSLIKKVGILTNGEQSFIRNGKTGGWRDYFDEDMSAQAEKWIADNLRDTNLRFPHLELNMS